MMTRLPLTCTHEWEHYVHVATGSIQRRECRRCGKRETIATPVIEAPVEVPAAV